MANAFLDVTRVHKGRRPGVRVVYMNLDPEALEILRAYCPAGSRQLGEFVSRLLIDRKPRQHLVYLSVHISRPCWIGGRPLISMIGLSHDEDTFCLSAAPLLVKPRPIE